MWRTQQRNTQKGTLLESEYLIDRIKRKEGGGKELDEGKENKGRITKEKDDRKNNERDVAEKEEYKEEDQEEGEEEEEDEGRRGWG